MKFGAIKKAVVFRLLCFWLLTQEAEQYVSALRLTSYLKNLPIRFPTTAPVAVIAIRGSAAGAAITPTKAPALNPVKVDVNSTSGSPKS